MMTATTPTSNNSLVILVLLIGVMGRVDCFSLQPIGKRSLGNRNRELSNLLLDTNNESGQTTFFQRTDTRREDTPEEAKLRVLWEADPFETVTALTQSVVSAEDLSVPSRPWLTIADATDPLSPLPEEYQQLFCRALKPSIAYQPPISSVRECVQSQQYDSKKEDHKGFCSFRLDIAYMGESFCGWQTQPHNKQRPSVQESLELWLQPMFQPSRRTQKILERSSDLSKSNTTKAKTITSPRVNIRVAGRTDAGVHAIGQVARFRTWTKGGGESTFQWNEVGQSSTNETANCAAARSPSDQLQDYINQHPLAGTAFRCLSAAPVSSKFHPTFGASCRAYLYFVDSASINNMLEESAMIASSSVSLERFTERLNTMLGALEGQDLDYVGMSYGKVKTQSTLCNLKVARAFCVESIGEESHDEKCALCIQLVGNRFLRRMVRILVATALREALLCEENGNNLMDNGNAAMSLVNILQTKDRTLTARPAPPQGLIFAGALFD